MIQISSSRELIHGTSELVKKHQNILIDFQNSLESGDLKGCFENIIKINYALNPEKDSYLMQKIRYLENKRLMDSKSFRKMSLIKKNKQALGREKTLVIDEQKNEEIVNLVKLISDKSKCEDLF
jgi:hypothetical protein